MFIGNVLGKSTRSLDWFLLLYFFVNGIGSRVFQNTWYQPLDDIYYTKYRDFLSDSECSDCDTVFTIPEEKNKNNTKPSIDSKSKPKTNKNKISPTKIVDPN